MKFDVVLGNPPYQMGDGAGGQGSSASPIYPDFVNSAIDISDIQSIIIPARWLSGSGRGLGQFAESMISSLNFKHFEYFTNSHDVFPNNDISGGVCYFVRDNNYEGLTNIVTHSSGGIDHSVRHFDKESIGVFIPYEVLSNILSKVNDISDLDEDNMYNLVSANQPYGLRADYLNNPMKYDLPEPFPHQNNDSDIEVLGLVNTVRSSRFIPYDYPIPRVIESFDKYKVFVGKAYGGKGMLGEADEVAVLGKPIIATPNQICTETYLSVGSFNSKNEAISLYKYFHSKFLRVLVGIKKTTQDASRGVYSLVPLQDFTENSDIDWSKSIPEIDQQLYKKYGLNEEEIEFIETHVKEME